jgi:hypothetical protein
MDRFAGSIGITARRLGFWKESTIEERDPQAGAPARVPGFRFQVPGQIWDLGFVWNLGFEILNFSRSAGCGQAVSYALHRTSYLQRF